MARGRFSTDTGRGRCCRTEIIWEQAGVQEAELLISSVQVGKWRIKVDVDLDCSGRR